MSKFFINRPIFAWVIAIVLMVAGALAIRSLPIAQYPAIAPPSIAINVTYPGASAKTLEDTVTQVIEQKMNGIDHLRYLASTSDSAGRSEEHTSELQSQSNIVCRLLLEKKKTHREKCSAYRESSDLSN